MPNTHPRFSSYGGLVPNDRVGDNADRLDRLRKLLNSNRIQDLLLELGVPSEHTIPIAVNIERLIQDTVWLDK